MSIKSDIEEESNLLQICLNKISAVRPSVLCLDIFVYPEMKAFMSTTVQFLLIFSCLFSEGHIVSMTSDVMEYAWLVVCLFFSMQISLKERSA